MKNKEFDEFLNDDSPIENVKLDIDKVKENVPSFSNEKLCEMIVCDRYFGFGQKISPICMEELAKRRIAGDTFDFETYIDQAYKSLPELNFAIPDLRTVLNQVISQRLGKK
jgi:hypothetical protein